MHEHVTSSRTSGSRLRTTVATGIVAAAIALPVGWALAPAGASSTAPSSPTTTVAPSTTPSASDSSAGRNGARERRQERLAEELGVTVDELRDARLRVLEREVEDRVADGRISRAEGDEILEAARSGERGALRDALRRVRRAHR